MVKNILVASALLLLISCGTGRVVSSYDEFTGDTQRKLILGQLTSKNSEGLLHEITSSLSEVKNNKGVTNYYFFFQSYVESMGLSCPKTSKGSKAIFLVNGESFHSQVSNEPNIMPRSAGLLMPSCVEIIEVGPVSRAMLSKAIAASDLKFKIYGSRFALEGFVDQDKFKLIDDFIKNKVLDN